MFSLPDPILVKMDFVSKTDRNVNRIHPDNGQEPSNTAWQPQSTDLPFLSK